MLDQGYPALNLLQQLEVLRLYMEARKKTDSTLGEVLNCECLHTLKSQLAVSRKVILPKLINHLINSVDKGSNLIIEIEDDTYSIHIYVKTMVKVSEKGQSIGDTLPTKYRIDGMQHAHPTSMISMASMDKGHGSAIVMASTPFI